MLYVYLIGTAFGSFSYRDQATSQGTSFKSCVFTFLQSDLYTGPDVDAKACSGRCRAAGGRWASAPPWPPRPGPPRPAPPRPAPPRPAPPRPATPVPTLPRTDDAASDVQLECLRAVPWDDLLYFTSVMSQACPDTSTPLWQPTIDGYEWDQMPLDMAMVGGASKNVTLLLGDVADEGTLFTLSVLEPLAKVTQIDRSPRPHSHPHAQPHPHPQLHPQLHPHPHPHPSHSQRRAYSPTSGLTLRSAWCGRFWAMESSCAPGLKL